MKRRRLTFLKWLSPGLGIKRWLVLLLAGITILSIGIAQVIVEIYRSEQLPDVLYLFLLRPLPPWLRVLVGASAGILCLGVGLYALNRTVLAPYTENQRQSIVDVVRAHKRRGKGPKVVAIGGGTGLPSVLRGIKHQTGNLTAIVTMADDGGSSGRLRRDLGVLPPGDLRNNIAALADDEDLMTQLFQYRFGVGELDGHSFGNLFLTALSDIAGGMDRALAETERVLAVQGKVLPCTADEVTLMGEVWRPDGTGLDAITGESAIPKSGGRIERVFLKPSNARAYPQSMKAILSAELIVIGPGSLFTSILPNLLVSGIAEAIRASQALCVYVCNVATQPGETDGFNVADHVLTIERHVGKQLFKAVIANDHFPPIESSNANTHYVAPVPADHEVRDRYTIHYANLTDPQFPWRHDSARLTRALLDLYANHQGVLLRETA